MTSRRRARSFRSSCQPRSIFTLSNILTTVSLILWHRVFELRLRRWPESKKTEDGPRWRDISATATVDESTFVIKAEKLAGWAARTFKRKKPRQLALKISGKPLPAWERMYEPLEQMETIAAGDQTTIRLTFKPRQARQDIHSEGVGDAGKASDRKGFNL